MPLRGDEQARGSQRSQGAKENPTIPPPMHMGTNGTSAHQVGDLCASPDLVWLELDMQDGGGWLSSLSRGRGQTWLLGGPSEPEPEDSDATQRSAEQCVYASAPTTSLLCSKIRE